MGIDIKGNVGNLTNFESDGIQINISNAPIQLKQLINNLHKIMPLANKEEKIEIQNVLNGIKENNENIVLTSLKKVASFIGRVASSVSASIIVAYMKANGIIPQ